MRIEFVYNNSKALEIRLENRIQRIDDDLKTNIERIVKKRLQIYETASTTRRKERPDVIFGESLVTRTSDLLAFNNQHETAIQHKVIYRSFASQFYKQSTRYNSPAVDCEIRQSEIYLKLYFICMLSFCQGYFWKRSNSTNALNLIYFLFSQAICERTRLR